MSDPVVDLSSKIRVVIDEIPCNKHNAPVGFACFDVRTDSLYELSGICGARALKRFNGQPRIHHKNKENR